jgi:hypothetical protein
MLRTLTRVGMRRGLLGGSRPWTMVLLVAGGLRLIQRMAEGKEVVIREKLEPGTTLLITNDPEGARLATEALLADAAAPAKLEE